MPKILWAPKRKRCYRCKRLRLSKFFTKDKNSKDGLQFYCRDCDRELHRTIPSRTDPRLVRSKKIKFKYNMTLETFDSMLIKQQNRCAICQGPIDFVTAQVDHNHETNAIRGLLCGHCNKAIGLLRDDPITCDNAAAYLRLYQQAGGIGV